MTPPEIIPAEVLQAEADEPALITTRFGFVLLGLTLSLIALHWAWSLSL